MAEKPTAAFVLGLIGGIFILLNGLLIAAVGAFLAFFLPGLGIILAAIGLLFGVLALLGAIMLNSRPDQHVMWGVMVLIVSILSIFIGGGFIIGMILGIIGGALGIAFKPMPEMGAGMGGMGTMGQPMGGMGGMGGARHCTKCGAALPMGATACPNCGSPVM